MIRNASTSRGLTIPLSSAYDGTLLQDEPNTYSLKRGSGMYDTLPFIANSDADSNTQRMEEVASAVAADFTCEPKSPAQCAKQFGKMSRQCMMHFCFLMSSVFFSCMFAPQQWHRPWPAMASACSG